MSEEKDVLSGVRCRKCKILFQENNETDKFGEYIIEPIGYPLFCDRCRDEHVDEIIRKKKKWK